ncbi:Fur family transcriptional regulator [Sulfitobacter donghicola DSW-25 = KCTC 12864 = JCM 14565]|uniref:Fur family transcriptional regulator n=1 Tax=Sulfitobacter donghicola DSW-25 = KCTC 12864 = JCM 14565 TaxID=1300350 RepID=A0A073IK87_9RHOB|nr:Fur family transcriptional regulator [Sulfitobacter donghicola DSW-25 = KCTC 12864 = JCM 14565]
MGFQCQSHDNCMTTMLAEAQKHCSENGLRLTPVRRRTLEILLADHRAMGAYDVLSILAQEGLGSQPPVAYRALDFLVKAGFAHKIEALNAYTACVHPGHDHAPAFLICRKCQTIAEAETAPAKGRLGEAALAAGFVIERTVVEATGLCSNCVDGVA